MGHVQERDALRAGEPGEERIALYTHMRYESRRAPILYDNRALRRPELIVRRICHHGLVVDERLLARAYPAVPEFSRMQAFLVLDGALHYGGARPLAVGTALLLHPHHQDLLRHEDSTLLQIAWQCQHRIETPTPLGTTVDATAAATTFDDGPNIAQRACVRAVLDVFHRAGAPLPAFDVERMTDCTTARDLRIAEALQQQWHTLRSADAMALGELAGLSPRQLQRLFATFSVRFGFPPVSWRDTRGRWRLIVAAVLLCRPELTLAMIAEEVGYSSTAALGRAFVHAGYPPPAELRKLVMQPMTAAADHAPTSGSSRRK